MTTRAQAGLRIPRVLNALIVNEATKLGLTKNAMMLQILWNWARSEGLTPAAYEQNTQKPA